MKSTRPEQPSRTLRQRLLVMLLLPLSALLFVSLATDYHIAFDPVAEAYDEALADDAVALAGRVRMVDSNLVVDFPAAAEEVLRTDPNDQEFLSLYGPEGDLLVGDAGLHPDQVFVRNNLIFSDGEFRGKKIRKASYRVSTPAGAVVATVAETTRKRERAGSKILVAMIAPNVLLILATLILVYLGVRNGLAPLTHLSEEIGRRGAHDLSPLPKGQAPGEAEPLIKAMDGLVDDLRSAAVAQHAFLANAAHQLKTPLAGLQTQLELHIEELPGAYQNRAVRLLDATRRLAHLTHQLLALARSGPDANVSYEKRAVDLGKLLEASASMWFDLALARQIDLGFESDKAVVAGSEWLLRELLSNLIDNALNYTPPGGRVTARSGVADGGRPYVEVEDNGPGIPAEERERIFNRFYRPEGTPGEGTGLGLAIVKEVADRHDALIELHDAMPDGGTCIRVSFPPPVKEMAV